MGDKYLELANSKIGKSILSAVGLPEPLSLQRESHASPHRLKIDVRIGISTDAVFAKPIKKILKATDANILSNDLDAKSSG